LGQFSLCEGPLDFAPLFFEPFAGLRMKRTVKPEQKRTERQLAAGLNREMMRDVKHERNEPRQS
jgi:hypothetical protein